MVFKTGAFNRSATSSLDGGIPEHALLSTGVVHSAKLFSDNLSHSPVARTIACLVTLPSLGGHSPDRAPDTEFGGSL